MKKIKLIFRKYHLYENAREKAVENIKNYLFFQIIFFQIFNYILFNYIYIYINNNLCT